MTYDIKLMIDFNSCYIFGEIVKSFAIPTVVNISLFVYYDNRVFAVVKHDVLNFSKLMSVFI